jgi:uncharacterized protein YpiB (UPF0302 family)
VEEMNKFFIAKQMFQHQIDCFCPNGIKEDVVTIHRGDIIEITSERKYMMENGWYFLIRHNDKYDFYIALEDLETYYVDEKLASNLDIELLLNYFDYKIDQALDIGDEKSFFTFTTKLKEISDLKEKIEQYLHGILV